MSRKTPRRVAASWKAALKFGESFPRDEKYLAQLREFELTFSYPKLRERKREKKPGQTPRHEKVALRETLLRVAYRRR